MNSSIPPKKSVSNLLTSLKIPSGVEGDIYHEEVEVRTIGWADGKPNLQQASLSEAICLRIIQKGGEAILTTRQLEPHHLQELVEKALDVVRFVPQDPHRSMGKGGLSYPPPILNDEELFHDSIADVLARMEKIEKTLLMFDRRLKKVIKLACECKRKKISLVNSHGVDISKEGTEAQFVVEVLAEEGTSSEVAWNMTDSRYYRNLSMESLAFETAVHAVKSLGARGVPSGVYPVVLDPRVGVQFLHLLSQALSAEEVQLGRSFLKQKKGHPFGAVSLTIVDDPFQPMGVASAPFDDEGTPHQLMTLVSNGVLTNYLYDIRSATRDNTFSTGHGLKASLGASPRPHPTNLFIHAGSFSQEELLASHPQILLIRDIMGLHMADPFTGEFSFGASGYFYEKGQFQYPVRGITIAGQLGSIFQKVKGIGYDITWFGQLGSPSLLISDVTVGGV